MLLLDASDDSYDDMPIIDSSTCLHAESIWSDIVNTQRARPRHAVNMPVGLSYQTRTYFF